METTGSSDHGDQAGDTRPVVADAQARPNRPVAAALLATGIGALVLAILVIVAEAKPSSPTR